MIGDMRFCKLLVLVLAACLAHSSAHAATTGPPATPPPPLALSGYRSKAAAEAAARQIRASVR